MSRASGASESFDQLVLTDETAQFARESAGARFERRVLHHLVRLHGEGSASEGGEEREKEEEKLCS